MDDIWGHLEAALWAFLGKAAGFCLELATAGGRKALELAALAAGRLDALAARIGSLSPWLAIPLAVVLAALVVCYLMRQRLYDRVLVYHLTWLTRRGFSRRRLSVRRGAVRRSWQAMARPVPLPQRFGDVALYEVEPDRYAVAYGLAGGWCEDVRTYRRDLRTGLMAMGADLTAYFRVRVRMLHADAELRALFAVLDAFDPAFAACRPRLPGEAEKKAASDVWSETAHDAATGGGVSTG